MHIETYRQSRYFAVYDDQGVLICVTVYRKGAVEVVRRLQALEQHPGQAHNGSQPEPPGRQTSSPPIPPGDAGAEPWPLPRFSLSRRDTTAHFCSKSPSS